MTTRLTPARQVPSVLGRLSTMCRSRLVPRGRPARPGGLRHPKCLYIALSCHIHGVTSKMLQRDSRSLAGSHREG